MSAETERLRIVVLAPTLWLFGSLSSFGLSTWVWAVCVVAGLVTLELLYRSVRRLARAADHQRVARIVVEALLRFREPWAWPDPCPWPRFRLWGRNRA